MVGNGPGDQATLDEVSLSLVGGASLLGMWRGNKRDRTGRAGCANKANVFPNPLVHPIRFSIVMSILSMNTIVLVLRTNIDVNTNISIGVGGILRFYSSGIGRVKFVFP